MKEITDIIKQSNHLKKEQKNAVLATVVHITGSSFRQPGARMLIDETGRMTGAISGGCLEKDVLKKALLTLSSQRNTLLHYDTSDTLNTSLGAQLGCEGIIYILLEPIYYTDKHNAITVLETIEKTRSACALVSLFDIDNLYGLQLGTCFLYRNGDIYTVDKKHYTLSQLVKKSLTRSTLTEKENAQKTHVYHFQHAQFKHYALIEWIKPVIHCLILGEGQDALHLEKLTSQLGWKTTLLSHQENTTISNIVSEQCNVISLQSNDPFKEIAIDDRTAAILMSHRYQSDLNAWQSLIKRHALSKLFYASMLGPKIKFQKILDELKNLNIYISDIDMKKIFSPAGLDIQAETPEEIALSITTEILQIANKANNGHLKEKEKSIHAHRKQAIQKIKL